MRVTTAKYINARSSKPSVDAVIPFFRPPGFSLGIDKILIGDKIDGNSIWYRCKEDGCYYWSGGINETEFSDQSFAKGDFSAVEWDEFLGQAKDYFFRKYQQEEGFSGISIADKRINGVRVSSTVLAFQVLKKINSTKWLLPAVLKFKGFELLTDVDEADFASFQFAYIGNDNPRKLSGSISRLKRNDWGSCGLKVEGSSAENKGTYLLTNYHVLAADLLNEQTYNYTAGELNRLECTMPAWHFDKSAENIMGHLYQGVFNSLFDIALVKLTVPDKVSTSTPYGHALVSSFDLFNNSIYKNAVVAIYGSMSGNVSSTIVSTNTSKPFLFNGRMYTKEKLIQIVKNSLDGDSGCPVLLNNEVIGILIGADQDYSYVIPIQRILTDFSLKIARS